MARARATPAIVVGAGATTLAVIAAVSLTAAAVVLIGLGVAVVSAGAVTGLARGDRSSPAAIGEVALASARDLVSRYGEDSLAPFILRPDKTFHFAGGGVLAYRRVGRTAVVSGDPVAPPHGAPAVLASFLELARRHGWHVVLYGASSSYLPEYRRLGMRSLCVGEEAVVRPDAFTLEGRAVRKLRQSVHRVERRGWRIVACDGADIDLDTEAEIDALELAWRTTKRRLLGFAMGMGPYEGGIASGDLFVLARSPDGRLAASMRFISHRGKLSLDTMRRVGDTPNGLNEALVCTALELARQRRIPEVSLNYAGLAHLLRSTREGGWVRRRATSIVVAALGRHFQMERLVRFNDKFSPEWRPRHLVYGSRRGLPGAMLRVLQAEGYLPHRTEQAESQVMREPARAAVSPESMRAGATGR